MNPVLPTERQAKTDPTKQAPNRARAFKKLSKKYRNIKKEVRKMISELPVTVANAKTYEYQIDADRYAAINSWLEELFYSELLDNESGIFTSSWWLNSHLNQAFDRGTSDALQSAKNVTVPSVAGAEVAQAVRSIDFDAVKISPGYLRRVGLIQARVFENMKSLCDSSKADLADTLGRQMAAGNSIAEATKAVVARVGVSKSRAERIVRTEINNAYTKSYNQEISQLNTEVYDDSDWNLRVMHQSAFAATSRRDHMARTGTISTPEEQERWWLEDAKGGKINCLCTVIAVLQNVKTGEVLQKGIVDEAKRRREEFV